MKITVFVASGRKRHTQNAAEYFVKELHALGSMETEIVRLSDYNLEICRGCRVCFDKGEEMCPMKDDRDILFEKIRDSDGVVFATPNYSFDMSGHMKVFLDRLGYAFHRPAYFGKAFTSIVVQGFYRGNKIIQYFNFISKYLGFNVVKGICLNSLEPMNEKDHQKFNGALKKHVRKFHSVLSRNAYPTPDFSKLMIFRMARTSIRLLLNESFMDYNYYSQNGWFDSDYYYKTRLNPLKKSIGKLFDLIFAMIYSKKLA